MAAGLSVDLDRWRQEFDELLLRLGGRFARAEPRRRMAAFMRGLLAVLAAAQPGGGRPRDDHLIPLTCHEICRLFTGLSQQPSPPAIQLHWSQWRRRHQATAQAGRYRRRAQASS